MPITTRKAEVEVYDGDAEHWTHVIESLFVPAVEAAGFEAVIPKAKGSYLIHDVIVKNLETADLVLVDLSAHNPNVFFELGVRTSLNLPVALVWDKLTTLPFDTSGINTYDYDPTLAGWRLDEQRVKLTQHLLDSVESCRGKNPLWRHFGLQSQATEPITEATPESARVELLEQQVAELRHQVLRATSSMTPTQTKFRHSAINAERAASHSALDTASDRWARASYVTTRIRARLANLNIETRVTLQDDDDPVFDVMVHSIAPLPESIREDIRVLAETEDLMVGLAFPIESDDGTVSIQPQLI